jgi:transcriptional regulator with XRE-family HTH domain
MKEKVKCLLKQKGMNAKDLAKKMGISEAALSLSLNGNPTLSRIQEIADALGVELGELFAPFDSPLRCPKCGTKLMLVEYVEGEQSQEIKGDEKEATE